jgi:HK97 family phage major capsid protein
MRVVLEPREDVGCLAHIGLGLGFVGEGAALTASDASFDNVKMVAKKLTAFTKISTELSEDSIVNIIDWLTMDIGQQLAYLLSTTTTQEDLF